MVARTARIFLLVCLLSQLVACGQKGNLYLPDATTSVSSSSTTFS